MMPFHNTRSGSNRDAMAAYHGVSPTDQEIDDYGYHHDYSASTQADSVSLPTTVHDDQWQSGLNVESRPSHPDPETMKGTRRSAIYFSAILLISTVPLCGMIAWIITVIVQQGGSVFTGLGSAKIAGHLTQTQAKAIDFLCGALFAPLLMAGLNFIWFACARVCVVNEHSATHLSSHGVPLQSLARASRTSVGTYDLVGLWELFSAKTWRLSVLGAVALLSAVSSSALSNIIAYESFEQESPSMGTYTLRMLSDALVDGGIYNGFDEVDYYSGIHRFDFGPTHVELAAYNMSKMLHGLPFQNVSLDSEGGYMRPNATDSSLNSVERKVTRLHNVPGYRLTADCVPTAMVKNSIRINDPASPYKEPWLIANVTPAAAAELNVGNHVTRDTTRVEYHWTGRTEDYFLDTLAQFDLPAFDPLTPESVYLVHLAGDASVPYRDYEVTIPTEWGDLSPAYQDITMPDFERGLTKLQNYSTNSYALQCVLLRQEGLLEYRRRDDQSWFIAESNFQNNHKPVISLLQGIQIDLSTGHHAPPLEGVLWGGATDLEVCHPYKNNPEECDQYKNFSTAVNNLVYASGETLRIMYNVAALNTSRDKPDYFYNVTGEVETQFYRITYVPALLLVALLGIIICSLLVTVLVISTMKTWSWKMFRQVDITRLVVDCVGADLANNGPDFTQLGRASDGELAKWAGKYRVGYEKAVDVQNDDGDAPWVRLRHTAGGDVQKPGSDESIHSVGQ